MLEYEPTKRWSAFECLNHPYFKDIQKSTPWKITKIYRSLNNKPVTNRLYYRLTTLPKATPIEQSIEKSSITF